MNIELIEVYQERNISYKDQSVSKQEYSLRKVYINPEHVVCMRMDDAMCRRLVEGQLPPDLNSQQEFTRLYINRGQTGLDVIVVGNPALVQEKIDSASSRKKELLKG